MHAGNHQAAQPAVRRGQRKRTHRLQPGLLHDARRLRKTPLAIERAQHQRLLVLVHPGGHRLLFGDLSGTVFRIKAAGTQMNGDFGGPFVKLRDGVKLQHLAQFVDQNTEQFAGVPLSSDRRGDPNQRFIALRSGVICFGYCDCRTIHDLKTIHPTNLLGLDAANCVEDSYGCKKLLTV